MPSASSLAHHLPPAWRNRPLTSMLSGSFAPVPEPAPALAHNRFASTDEVINSYVEASEGLVSEAIEGAKKAQPAWARLSPTERGRVLTRASQLLTARTAELAMMETINTSRAIAETSVVDVKSAADCFEYFGGSAAVQQVGETHRLAGGCLGYTTREALGVAVGIGAFNYPLQSAAWKAAPALAFGNAMVRGAGCGLTLPGWLTDWRAPEVERCSSPPRTRR
jgi:acyl-CoA reductase-like NAD-dependent aldehyde dehydrogenase